MNFKRLFHVLVLGSSVISCEKARTDAVTRQGKDGAAVADGSEDSEGEPTGDVAAEDGDQRKNDGPGADGQGQDRSADGDNNVASDAGSTDIASVITDANTDGLPGERPAGALCLCSPTKCCDLHEGAPATVTPGFVCCWATSC